jgi:hypothetical protein
VIELIRKEWKETQIIVRGDSAYSCEEIMYFCEEKGFIISWRWQQTLD